MGATICCLARDGPKHKTPILATGIWRDGSADKALAALRTDFTIDVLSQDNEAYYESLSIMTMLTKKGRDTNQCILTVGSGSGSCQFVLFNKGKEVAKAYSNGYKNEATGHETKIEAFRKIWPSCPGGKGPDLIVSWGATYYACKGGPVNDDEKELMNPVAAGQYLKVGFITPEAKQIPMMVIRNIDMGNGQIFKAHWGVESLTGRYIDLGSGKAARVSREDFGKQEKNIAFDTKKAQEGDAVEVREALKTLLDKN